MHCANYLEPDTLCFIVFIFERNAGGAWGCDEGRDSVRRSREGVNERLKSVWRRKDRVGVEKDKFPRFYASAGSVMSAK